MLRLQRTGILPTESGALGLSLLQMHHAFADLDLIPRKLARMASFLGIKRAKALFCLDGIYSLSTENPLIIESSHNEGLGLRSDFL